VERFNLRKLNELRVRKQYQIKISNRYADLEKLNDSKNITAYIKTSAKENLCVYELKQTK